MPGGGPAAPRGNPPGTSPATWLEAHFLAKTFVLTEKSWLRTSQDFFLKLNRDERPCFSPPPPLLSARDSALQAPSPNRQSDPRRARRPRTDVSSAQSPPSFSAAPVRSGSAR